MKTILSATNFLLYIAIAACIISVVPHSLGLEIMDFEDIVSKKVGEDLGQELYQNRFEYLSKFKKKGKEALEGKIDAGDLPPLMAASKASELSEDYLQERDMQLYIAGKAEEYKRIGKMKAEHYKQLLEKKVSLEELNDTLKKIKKMRAVFNKQLLSN